MDAQFEEFMRQATTIIYWVGYGAITAVIFLLGILIWQLRKQNRKIKIFELGLRQRFFDKYGHHNYFKSVKELKKDAEKVRNIKGNKNE